jgi:outer membrane cobalamin receptor
MPKTNTCILVVLLLLSSVQSYCGTLKGSVIDKQTGEPIIGGVVVLHGTRYGTTTGLDGSYEIRNIPAGEYDLEMMYTSFTTFHQHIVVKDAETLTINELLEPTTESLTEVEVKAKAKNGSDEQARNIEKNSDQLLNVMSARTIELLPDITVANVLQRVSGVQVTRDANGEARYATIRGMDKMYNYTTVNGVKIASPDDKGRYVPLDVFPAEIMDRVEVIKSLTPDMEGDAIGGVTNLVMKKAPDNLLVYASVATGYNQNSFNEHFTSFDKNDVAKSDPSATHPTGYAAQPNDFQMGSTNTKQAQSPPNGLYSLSLGNRFLKHKQLGVMLSGSYQNTYKITDGIFFKPAAQPGATTTQSNLPEFDDLNLFKYSTQETRTGLHTNIDYRINSKNTIDLYGLFVQLNQQEDRFIIDTTLTGVNRFGLGQGSVSITNRTAFRKINIGNLTLKGTHELADNLVFDWTGAVSKSTRDVPDMDIVSAGDQVSKNAAGQYVTTPEILNSVSKSWEKTTDQDAQLFLNLTYKPSIFGQDIEFKGGGMYRTKERDNYYNKYTLQPNNSYLPYSSSTALSDTAFAPLVHPAGDPNDALTYHETEQIYGYYAQAKADFIDNKLQVLVGVRIEHTHVEDSMDQNSALVDGVAGKFDYTDVLPGVHLKYKLSKRENLRLSYFESITRPAFADLVNYSFPGEQYTELGNAHLNHSVAQNVDARYELYPKGIDELFVGAFYKNIANPIQYTIVRDGGPSTTELQPNNIGTNAINYGAEIQVVKYFHYFGVSANYTYTHSAVSADRLSYMAKPNGGGDTTVSAKETLPLQGQAAHVANLALIYKNPKIGFDAKLSLQYTGRYIALLSPYVGLDYYQRGTPFLDFSAEKKIAKHIAVYVKVNNILNTKKIVELDASNKQFTDPKQPLLQLPYQNLADGKTLVERTDYGQNYLIGIRFKLD